jgi:hypothetical protein
MMICGPKMARPERRFCETYSIISQHYDHNAVRKKEEDSKHTCGANHHQKVIRCCCFVMYDHTGTIITLRTRELIFIRAIWLRRRGRRRQVETHTAAGRSSRFIHRNNASFVARSRPPGQSVVVVPPGRVRTVPRPGKKQIMFSGRTIFEDGWTICRPGGETGRHYTGTLYNQLTLVLDTERQ